MRKYTTITPYLNDKANFPDNLQDYAPWVSQHGLNAPYGECQCGCGEKTKIAPHDNPDRGCAKNHPRRFVFGHATHARGNQFRLNDFWKNVFVGKPDDCWAWNGNRQSNGYGSFCVGGLIYSTHRISYELHYGKIPEGLMILHSCDNPSCVNPAHLSAGTQFRNMQDCNKKGRANHPKGDKSKITKFSDETIRNIRERCANGERQIDLAREYKMSKKYVWKIVHRKERNHD